jgi:hypothetical protein
MRMIVFSTLMPRSNENRSCMRVDESWLDINYRARIAKTLINSHQNLKQFKVSIICFWLVCSNLNLILNSWWSKPCTSIVNKQNKWPMWAINIITRQHMLTTMINKFIKRNRRAVTSNLYIQLLQLRLSYGYSISMVHSKREQQVGYTKFQYF